MSHRKDQVGKELLKALSRIIQGELPLERYGLITITDVVVTPGLERATIFVSALQNGRDAVSILNSRRKKLKQLLHSAVKLRKIPQLTFTFDISVERSERIDKILENQ